MRDQGKDATPQRSAVNKGRFDDRSPEPKRDIGDDQSVDRASLSHRSHSPAPPKTKGLRSAVSSVPRSDNDGPDGDRFQDKKLYQDDSFGDEPPRKTKTRPTEDFGYTDNSFGNRQFQDGKDRSRDRGMADFPASPPQAKEDFGGFKNDKPDNFGFRQEDRRGPPPQREGRDWAPPPRSPQHMDEPPRRKRGFDDQQEFDDMKRSKRFHDDVEPPRAYLLSYCRLISAKYGICC